MLASARHGQAALQHTGPCPHPPPPSPCPTPPGGRLPPSSCPSLALILPYPNSLLFLRLSVALLFSPYLVDAGILGLGRADRHPEGGLFNVLAFRLQVRVDGLGELLRENVR